MALLNSPPSNFSDVLTISEAADYLGVSTATLRNWDRSGKLKPRRHPQNGYRIYLHEDLDAVLRSADLSALTDEAFAPPIDWEKAGDSEHFVQFYENDGFLIESASGYLSVALRNDGCAIVATTPEHQAMLDRKLVAIGIDVTRAKASGQYIALDARETMSKFMVEGAIDPSRFEEFVGAAIGKSVASGRRIHAFGEMVALLWADGNRAAAIELERLWNTLAGKHRFSLLCAYPICSFSESSQADGFHEICSCHSRVIPAESYPAAKTEDQRLRAITLLQQKSESLAAEIQHRREVEKALCDADRRKDETLGTLSHELRKALEAIRVCVEQLNADTCDNATRQAAGSAIKRQVEQMTRLVDGLLNSSRAERD